jgi:hypothetical protein
VKALATPGVMVLTVERERERERNFGDYDRTGSPGTLAGNR